MKILVFIATLLYCVIVGECGGESLIVWNVGQGLWVTLATATTCTHFDMGGEKIDWHKVVSVCGKKINRAYFSHWDQDHISFAELASHKLSSYCVAAYPGGSGSPRKREMFSHLKPCAEKDLQVHELSFTPVVSRKKHASNEFCRIYTAENSLMPGDSTAKEERIWLRELPASLRVLILGHHGSRTSTSDGLLRALPKLKIAIASARRRRYGHPHKEVLVRLKEFGISELNTEDWNNIFIEQN